MLGLVTIRKSRLLRLASWKGRGAGLGRGGQKRETRSAESLLLENGDVFCLLRLEKVRDRQSLRLEILGSEARNWGFGVEGGRGDGTNVHWLIPLRGDRGCFSPAMGDGSKLEGEILLVRGTDLASTVLVLSFLMTGSGAGVFA